MNILQYTDIFIKFSENIEKYTDNINNIYTNIKNTTTTIPTTNKEQYNNIKIYDIYEIISILNLENRYLKTYPEWYNINMIYEKNNTLYYITCINTNLIKEYISLKILISTKLKKLIDNKTNILSLELNEEKNAKIKQILSNESLKLIINITPDNLEKIIKLFIKEINFFIYLTNNDEITKIELVNNKYIFINNIDNDIKSYKIYNLIIDKSNSEIKKTTNFFDSHVNKVFTILNKYKEKHNWYNNLIYRFNLLNLKSNMNLSNIFKYLNTVNIENMNYYNEEKKEIEYFNKNINKDFKINKIFEIKKNNNSSDMYLYSSETISYVEPNIELKLETNNINNTDTHVMLRNNNIDIYDTALRFILEIFKDNQINKYVYRKFKNIIFNNFEKYLYNNFDNGLTFIDMLFIKISDTNRINTFIEYFVNNINLIYHDGELVINKLNNIINLSPLSSLIKKIDILNVNDVKMTKFLIESYLFLFNTSNSDFDSKNNFIYTMFYLYKNYILYANKFDNSIDLDLYIISRLDIIFIIYNSNLNLDYYIKSSKNEDIKLYITLYKHTDNMYYNVSNTAYILDLLNSANEDACNNIKIIYNYEFVFEYFKYLFDDSDFKFNSENNSENIQLLSKIDIKYDDELCNIEIFRFMNKILKNLKIIYILVNDNTKSYIDFYNILIYHIIRCYNDYTDETINKCKKYLAYILLINKNENYLLSNLLKLTIFDLIDLICKIFKYDIIYPNISIFEKENEINDEIEESNNKLAHTVLHKINILIGYNYTKDNIDGDYRFHIEKHFRTTEGQFEIKMSQILNKLKLYNYKTKEEIKFRFEELKIQIATELLLQNVFEYKKTIYMFEQLYDYYNNNIFSIYIYNEEDDLLNEELKCAIIMAEYTQVFKILKKCKISFSSNDFINDFFTVRDICYLTYEKFNNNSKLTNIDFYDLASALLLESTEI